MSATRSTRLATRASPADWIFSSNASRSSSNEDDPSQRGVTQELAIDKELYRSHPDCHPRVLRVRPGPPARQSHGTGERPHRLPRFDANEARRGSPGLG